MGGTVGRLDGKVTIVTGGASGMGEAATELFVREGPTSSLAICRSMSLRTSQDGWGVIWSWPNGPT